MSSNPNMRALPLSKPQQFKQALSELSQSSKVLNRWFPTAKVDV
jgi:hypothetical protein